MDLPGGMGLPGGAAVPGGADLPGGTRRPPGGGGFGGDQRLTDQQRKILDYVVENAGGTRIALAVEGGAMATSAYILDSDATVIGMGGFSGMDDAPSVNQLQTWTAAGDLRYVLGRGTGGGMGRGPGMGSGPAQQRADWLTANCAEVPAADYGGQQNADAFTASILYDCASRPVGQT
jgi:hypothetical protein